MLQFLFLMLANFICCNFDVPTMAHFDFIVLFIFLDMCDPLVAFMNSYCMFKS